jgi:DNA-directed RNA polymerase specialized sigma subunit
MNVRDLTHIPDPMQRFAQSQKFLREIKRAEESAVKIRSQALLELRDSTEEDRKLSQRELGQMLGVSQQRISQMLKRAEVVLRES